MKKVGVKISIIVYLIVTATFILASYGYDRYMKLDRYQEDLHLSLYLRGYAKDVEEKYSEKDARDIVNYFKKTRLTIREKYRTDAMTNVIQALNANSKQLRDVRFKEFQSAERKFYDETLPAIDQMKAEFRNFVLFSILCPLFGLLLLSLYLKRKIVVPLQRLSTRMMDFLVDRYTFKFAEPDSGEIGDLQRTFNSLAQRAVNNMDELKALDRAKSEFVSIASHELRTPLTSIKGSLGILTSGVVGEVGEEALGLIKIAEQETDRLVRLINNLLDLAKMESNTFKLQKEWQSVQKLAESSLESLLGLSQTAKVKLEINRPEEDIEANLDKDRIQQVITNLMSNAIKYSPRKESVVLSYGITPENHLEIAITDRGPGIPEHDQKLIFEKFRQATQPESKLVKGTGLGLAISKALVEEHGGHIQVRSMAGLGSTFSFTIPEWRNATDVSTGAAA